MQVKVAYICIYSNVYSVSIHVTSERHAPLNTYKTRAFDTLKELPLPKKIDIPGIVDVDK